MEHRPVVERDPEFEQIVSRIERRERTERHVRLLGISWLVISGLGLTLASFLFAAIAPFGLLFGDPGAVGFFGVLGALIGGSVAAVSLPGIVAGFGLIARRRWGRTLAVILAAFALLHVPVGTILGGLTLAVLLGEEAGRVFGATPRPS